MDSLIRNQFPSFLHLTVQLFRMPYKKKSTEESKKEKK